MKQFGKILKFELKNYLTNKVFVGLTLFLVFAIAIVMFFPRVAGLLEGSLTPDISPEENIATEDSGQSGDVAELPVMLIKAESAEQEAAVKEAFAAAFIDYEVRISADSLEKIKEQIINGEAECAFVMKGTDSYTYYVENLSMYDTKPEIANEVLQNIYRIEAMMKEGIPLEEAGAILGLQIAGDIESLGKDQMENFFYTYIMIFALYMVILLYGQMVSTNVATEKSSRAMELLVTSAKPTSMMFGKVLASCLAGFIQLVAVFGSALICYNLNKAYWGENMVIDSIFNIPVELLIYMLIFFVLGFLIYAFLFGAIGSTASKLEDINTSTMPLMFMFIIAFMVVMFSMSSGTVDNMAMLICSYIPFTSPMAMFTRIAMSTVPWYEIVISITILVGSVIGVGVLSAKIYRVGVLLYGTTPKIGSILKAVWKA